MGKMKMSLWIGVLALVIGVALWSKGFMGSKATLEKAKAANLKADLSGRSALVFGGTSGIGQAMALRLAQAGASVTIVGRNEKVGAQTVEELKKLSSSSGGASHAFLKCDCMQLTNCRDLAAKYTASSPRLDYLLFCHTIATTQGRTPTPEGIDQKLALNYYSRWYITEALLPLMQKTAQSDANADVRVMSVLSAGYHKTYAKWKEDPHLSEKNYGLSAAADTAGFYNDLWLDKKSRDVKDVTFVHAAPGFVSTNWGTEMNFALRGVIRGLQAVGGRPAAECAEYLLPGFVAPELRGGFRLIGQYAEPMKKTDGHSDEAVEYIWDETQKEVQRALAAGASSAAVPKN